MKNLFAAALLLAAPAMLWAQPPAPTEMARQNGFTVVQLSTTDAKQLLADWAKPTPEARLQTQTTTTRHQPIHTFISFAGCKKDAAGECHVVASFVVLDPAGKPYSDAAGITIFRGPPPPNGNFALGTASLGVKVETGEGLGSYTVKVETTDKVAGITLRTQQVLTVTEAPRVGGWQPVPNPGKAPELKGPAKAMIAQISKTPLRLAQIEKADKQVVSGTRYRLRLRLTNGERWQGVVWRKLDGTYEVSELAQIAR